MSNTTRSSLSYIGMVRHNFACGNWRRCHPTRKLLAANLPSIPLWTFHFLTSRRVKDLEFIRGKFCVELTNNKTLRDAVHISRTYRNPLRFLLIPNDTDVKIVKSRYFLWVMKVVILIQFDAVQYCCTSNSNRQPLLCATFSLNTIAHFYRYEYILFPTRWKQSIDFEK